MPTILFKRDKFGECIDPVIDHIRQAVRSERRWGMQGFRDWALEHYQAQLRSGIYNDWTSIKFKTEESYQKFCSDFAHALATTSKPESKSLGES